MVELTLTNAGWWMIADGSNWVATCLLTFYCNPYRIKLNISEE